ncbi:hypothetical protein [Xylophilus sp. Leaf220]|uniref:hypothetical protein n=1 Tax=Xylophilus sp. Leaf220 TaxID=1735686 RepID=UPI0012E1E5CB|nr:hypothetical protein [Xylophilus sp. Leaf220]
MPKNYEPPLSDKLLIVAFFGSQLGLLSILFAGIWTTHITKFYVPTTLIFIFFVLIYLWAERADNSKIRDKIISATIRSAAGSIAIVSFGFGISHIYKLIPVAPNYKTAIPVALGAFTIGLGCYFIRRKYRRIWGATEIVAGIAIVVYRTYTKNYSANLMDAEYFIAFITAGIYLMVRGFDNLEQGAKIIAEKRRLDKQKRRQAKEFEKKRSGVTGEIAHAPSTFANQ